MPAINNMDNKIMPTNPNTQLKLFFNVAKKTMEKRINVAPSFQYRKKLAEYLILSFMISI